MKSSGCPECIFCKLHAPHLYFAKSNQHGTFPIMRCPSCKSAFVWPRPHKDKINAYYKNDSYKNFTPEQAIQLDRRYYPDSKRDSNRITRRCSDLSRGNNFLDVGAGFGMFSKAAHEKGFHVSACEPNENSRKVFSQINGFEPDPGNFDREYAMNHKLEFDVVLLSQVLEHVRNPEETVLNISTVLRKDGIAAIAVPHFGSALSRVQGKRDMFISPPEHLNFFSRRGLICLFVRNNFRLEFDETVSKVNRGRIEDVIGIRSLSHAIWITFYSILKVSEIFNMGMVINAYFRKIS